MSGTIWQYERPTGARLAILVTAALVAIAAAGIAGSRGLAIRQHPADLAPTAVAGSSVDPPKFERPTDARDPTRSLLVGRARPERQAPATPPTTPTTQLRQTRIVSQALRHIRRRYVDPDRIDPPRMLEASLQAVAHAIAEVLVEAEGRDAQGRPIALNVQVGDHTLRLDCRAVQDLFQLDWALHRIVGFLLTHLPQQTREAHAEYVAVNGLLDTLDPYSAMLDPDAWQEMQTHTGGKFGGLGIRVLTRNGVLTVVGVIEDSPASRAGLLADDRILRIDGEDTLNMAIEDAVDRLRGKVGTGVILRIGRKTWPKARPVRVVRAIIQLKSVTGRRLKGGVVYARIKNFQRGTAAELHRLIKRLEPSAGARGLVLDLRGNPGGLLDEAVKVCDLLMDGGPVVITVAGGGRDREVRAAHSPGTRADLPVVVLVSRRSASASEIVAGALKESNRAVIMGQRTWGKGTVQVPFEIGDGALKLTIAKYLVPGDVSIQDVGVTPDIELRFVDVRRGRIALYEPRTRRIRRKPWARQADVEAAARRPVHRLRPLLPPRKAGGETPSQFRDQEPIRRALALLKTAGDRRAAMTLTRGRAWVSELRNREAVTLRARLQKLGVDWRPGAQPLNPSPSILIEPTKGGLEVVAGQSIRLPVRVRNRGRSTLYRVHVFSRSDAPALDGVEQVIGRLLPNQSRLVYLRLRPARRHLDLRAPVEIVVALDGKALPVSRTVQVQVIGLQRPAFAWRITLHEAVEEDGLLSAGEAATLRVEVENVGLGRAEHVVASLRSLAGRLVHLEKGRVRLGALKPGQRAVASFQLRGAKAPGGRKTGLLAARLQVAEDRLGVRRSERIVLPWRGVEATPLRLAAVRRQIQLRLGQWTRAPQIRVVAPSSAAAPPRVVGSQSAVSPVQTCPLRLRGNAHFESVSPGRRYLSVSVAGAKRAFVAGHGRKEVPFDVSLTLDKGLNRITILARSGREQASYTQVLVHCRPAVDPLDPESDPAPSQGAER